MQKNKRSPLLWAMVLIGLVCSLALLFQRISAEQSAAAAACAVSWEDVLRLAREDGRAPEAWLDDLSRAGVHYLIVTDETQERAAPAAQAAGMAVARAGDTARTGDAFLIPPISRDSGPSAYAAPQGDPSVPLALVETGDRMGLVMPAQFDGNGRSGPMVKAFYMYSAYSAHYVRQDGVPPESENILFRAMVERAMRLAVLTPLEYEDGGIVADPAAYRDMLDSLGARIASRGLTLGDTFSPLDAPARSPLLLAGAFLLAAACAVLLLCLLVPIAPMLENSLLGAGALVSVGGALLAPGLLQKLVAFGAAVLAPCFFALLLGKLSAGKENRLAALPLPLRFAAALLALLALSLAGGLYVGALLADRAYMLEFDMFTGVKLAQLLPLAAAAAVLFFALRRRPARDRRPLPAALIIFIAVCMAAAVAVLLLRSGDDVLPGPFETMVRTWLEQTLYVRPRTKEMLVAFPALALFLVAAQHRISVLELPLGVLAVVGSTSVVNTFCHISAPVSVSLIRTLLGGGIGLLAGWIAMGLLCLPLYGKRS